MNPTRYPIPSTCYGSSTDTPRHPNLPELHADPTPSGPCTYACDICQFYDLNPRPSIHGHENPTNHTEAARAPQALPAPPASQNVQLRALASLNKTAESIHAYLQEIHYTLTRLENQPQGEDTYAYYPSSPYSYHTHPLHTYPLTTYPLTTYPLTTYPLTTYPLHAQPLQVYPHLATPPPTSQPDPTESSTQPTPTCAVTSAPFFPPAQSFPAYMGEYYPPPAPRQEFPHDAQGTRRCCVGHPLPAVIRGRDSCGKCDKHGTARAFGESMDMYGKGPGLGRGITVKEWAWRCS